MRTIKELLILLRDYLPKAFVFVGGICGALSIMKQKGSITEYEYNIVLRYIVNRRPDITRPLLYWWWPYGELAPRLEFLDRLIAELG